MASNVSEYTPWTVSEKSILNINGRNEGKIVDISAGDMGLVKIKLIDARNFTVALKTFDSKYAFDFPDDCRGSRTKFLQWWKDLKARGSQETSSRKNVSKESGSQDLESRIDNFLNAAESTVTRLQESLGTTDTYSSGSANDENLPPASKSKASNQTAKQSLSTTGFHRSGSAKSTKDESFKPKSKASKATETQCKNTTGPTTFTPAATEPTQEQKSNSEEDQRKGNDKTKEDAKEHEEGMSVEEIEQCLLGIAVPVHVSNLVQPEACRRVRDVTDIHVKKIEMQLKCDTQFISIIGMHRGNEDIESLKQHSDNNKVEVVGGNHTREALQRLLSEGKLKEEVVHVRLYSNLSDAQCLRLGVSHNNAHEVARPTTFAETVLLFRKELVKLLSPSKKLPAQVKKWWLRRMAGILNVTQKELKDRYKAVRQLAESDYEVWIAVENFFSLWSEGRIKGQKGDLKPIVFKDFSRVKDKTRKISLLTELVEGMIDISEFKALCREGGELEVQTEGEIYNHTDVDSSDTAAVSYVEGTDLEVLDDNSCEQLGESNVHDESTEKQEVSIDTESDVLQLNAKLREMQGEMHTLSDESKRKDEEIASLQKSKAMQTTQIEKFRNLAGEFQAKCHELENQLANLRKELEQMKKQESKESVADNNVEKYKEMLKTVSSTAKEEKKQFEKEICRLRERLQEAEDVAARSRAAVSEYKKESSATASKRKLVKEKEAVTKKPKPEEVVADNERAEEAYDLKLGLKQKVWARWKDGDLYPAIIHKIEQENYIVKFDDKKTRSIHRKTSSKDLIKWTPESEKLVVSE